MRKTTAFLLAAIFLANPQKGQSEELDPDVAAGKEIYEAVTHRIGCERCHAPDGTAHAEGKTYAAERSIQGKSAQEIRIAIMATPMMWTIKLTDPELELVAAYLTYLQNDSD